MIDRGFYSYGIAIVYWRFFFVILFLLRSITLDIFLSFKLRF